MSAFTKAVLVLDFGGPYKEMIARRVRQAGVYSVIKPGRITAAEVRSMAPVGIILTGGQRSVQEEDTRVVDSEILELGIPVLGICYGMQLMCQIKGGAVETAEPGEYGQTKLRINAQSKLFTGLSEEQSVMMSHMDCVSNLPPGFSVTGNTENSPIAAFVNSEQGFFAVQFHVEADTTAGGKRIIENFLFDICGAAADYSVDDYIQSQIASIREQVGKERVLLALSGGVDSSVCAALLSRAVPGQLVCIFVDHGFMRLNEGDEVEAAFRRMDLNFVRINAQGRFLEKLRGVTDPEIKRKLVGAEFIEVFQEEALKQGNIKYLAQGTIYPDIIESGSGGSATIKSHHNVGGLPESMSFEELVEPLSGLFKDEVRVMGRKLGLQRAFVERPPFPGPGLSIRVVGEVTREKLEVLRAADAIFRQEIGKLRRRPDQYFAVHTGVRSVGVVRDNRTYEGVIALRAVNTKDFMTCEYTSLPHTVLARTAARIITEVDGAGRVVYDITSKPPGTIEWE